MQFLGHVYTRHYLLSNWNSKLTGHPVFYVNPNSYSTKNGRIWHSQCFSLLSSHFMWLLHLESNFQKCVEENQLSASTLTYALKLQGDTWQSHQKLFYRRPPWHTFLQLSNHPSGGCYVSLAFSRLPNFCAWFSWSPISFVWDRKYHHVS